MKRRVLINSGAAIILIIGLAGAANASHHRGHSSHIASHHPAHSSHNGGGMSGTASVYSGGQTANGEHASAGGLTAAHRSLPFGTLVKVTNRHSQRSVVVRINDRGPYVGGRVIDLTPAAAHAIGFSGLAPVTLSVVGHGGHSSRT
jgi:rare lipoprotein A